MKRYDPYDLKNKNFGKHRKKETREKISESRIGSHLSLKTRKLLSQINKGKKLSQQVRDNMSKAKKGLVQRLVKCSYCPKIGGYRTMTRWHFDNCKLKGCV